MHTISELCDKPLVFSSVYCKYNLYKNSHAVKKVCGSKMAGWNEMWNQMWWPRNGCDNHSKAKILISTIQVNLCVFLQGLGTNFTWIIIIKFFAIELDISWLPPLISHLSSPRSFGATPFFPAWLLFCMDITFLSLHIKVSFNLLQEWHGAEFKLDCFGFFS